MEFEAERSFKDIQMQVGKVILPDEQDAKLPTTICQPFVVAVRRALEELGK